MAAEKYGNFHLVLANFMTCSKWILSAAKSYHIDPYLISAICYKESRFNPLAERYEKGFYKKYMAAMGIEELKKTSPWVSTEKEASEECKSRATSWGPMQIMLQTAIERGFRGRSTELCGDSGVQFGTEYFSHQVKRHGGDIAQALSAYNQGTASSSNYETYVKVVLGYFDRLKQQKEVVKCFGENGS
jgi:soluble lytic murein transglycosylase-like protein